MITQNDKISNRQLQMFIILNLVGTAFIVLPRKIASFSYNDSFVSIILGTCLAIFSTYLIISCSKKYSSISFNDLCKKSLGNLVGNFVCLLFVFKIILTTGIFIRIFTEIISEIMLPTTPTFIVGLLMLLISAFLASKGLETIARSFEIIFILIILFILLCIYTGISNFNLINLTPIFINPISNTLKGSLIVVFSFSGLEYLFVIYPYVNNKKTTTKSSIIAVTVVGVTLLIVTTVCLMMFGQYGLSRQMWPVLEMMNSINFPGSFIERQDAFMLSFWIFMVFSSCVCSFFTAAILQKNIFNKGSHTTHIIIILICCFLVSIFPSNISIFYINFDHLSMILTSFFMLSLPLIILFMTSLRKKFVLPAFIFIFLVLPLTGCYDKVELEQRSFVLTAGIDKCEPNETGDVFSLVLSIPTTDGESRLLKHSTGTTITQSITNANLSTDSKLDFKNIRTIIISHEILKDEELFREVMDVLDRNSQLSRKVILMATEDQSALDVVSVNLESNKLIGNYIGDFYVNNSNNISTVYFNDLETILLNLLKNDTAVLPKIYKNSDKEVTIKDGILIDNFTYKTTITDDYTIGYSFITNHFLGVDLITNINNSNVDIKLSSGKTKTSFFEKDGVLYYEVKINAQGSIKEYTFKNKNLLDVITLEELSTSYETLINKEVIKTYEYFNTEMQIDAFNIIDELKSKDYDLYKKYAKDKNPQETLNKMEMEVTSKVKINSVGSVE